MNTWILVFFIAAGTLFAQADEFRTVENKAFGVGEKLTFEVKYGFVTAGIAYMEIPREKSIAGRDVLQVKFSVNSLPSFDWFYRVRTRYESYVDKLGIFSWRFEQHIREGDFKADFSAFFDQRRHIARTSGGEGDYEVPPQIHDIISAFYFARTKDYSDMKEGDTFVLQNFHDKELHDLIVVFKGRETVSVAAGTFDTFILEPLVEEGGLFKSEGSILVWMTDDDLKVPVKVSTKVIIGSIDAELTEYKGLMSDFTSKH